MSINFSGFQNAGHLVLYKPNLVNKNKKEVLHNCVWARPNNIDSKDFDLASGLLKQFPSNNGVLHLSVDSRDTRLKKFNMRINGSLIGVNDKNLGVISKVSKFLKSMMEAKDDSFSLDMNEVHSYKIAQKVDKNMPEALRNQSLFKMFDTRNTKSIAERVFKDLQIKVGELMNVKSEELL